MRGPLQPAVTSFSELATTTPFWYSSALSGRVRRDTMAAESEFQLYAHRRAALARRLRIESLSPAGLP